MSVRAVAIEEEGFFWVVCVCEIGKPRKTAFREGWSCAPWLRWRPTCVCVGCDWQILDAFSDCSSVGNRSVKLGWASLLVK